MEPLDMELVRICTVAFTAVLVILSLLAAVISGICQAFPVNAADPVSYTHLRAHET